MKEFLASLIPVLQDLLQYVYVNQLTAAAVFFEVKLTMKLIES